MSLTRAPAQEPSSFHPGLAGPLLTEQAGAGGRIGLQEQYGNGFLAALAGLGQRGLPAAEAGVDGLVDGVAGAVAGVPLLGPVAEALATDTKWRTEASVGFARGGLDMASGLVALASDPGAALRGAATLAAHTPGVQSWRRVADGVRAWQAGEGTLSGAALSAFDHGKSWGQMKDFWGEVGGNAAAPYLEAWEAGRPFEAAGRAGFELAMTLATAGTGGSPTLKALSWAEDAGDLSRGAKTGVNAAESALAVANRAPETARAATAVNRFEKAELDELVAAGLDRMGKDPAFAGVDLSKIASGVQLQSPAKFFREYVRKMMGQGVDYDEALERAAGMDAYRHDSQTFFRDDLAPHLREEVVQHELLHHAGHSTLAGFESLDEALTQWKTTQLLGRETTHYPRLRGAMEGLEQRLGAPVLSGALVDGPKELLARLNMQNPRLDVRRWLDQLLDEDRR